MRGPLMTITEFLEARIAEDEADAKGALGLHWDGNAFQQVRTGAGEDPHYYKIASGQVSLEHWEPKERLDPGSTFRHMARHDPARVLAECAAKRAMLAVVTGWAHDYNDDDTWYSCGLATGYYDDEPGGGCADDSKHGRCTCGLESRRMQFLEPLAAVYADHPDYRHEWAV